MTKIIKRKLYCDKCKEYYVVPVVLSTNSFVLNHDARLKDRAKNGELFKNLCPVCKRELVYKEHE